MSESMIERVARALQQAHHHRGRGIAPKWEVLDKFEREMWFYSARAAIEEMREPTDAMIDAAYGWLSDTAPLIGKGTADPEGIFKAMIDAALTEHANAR